MKKSSFLALVGGVISGMLFSLGMCMALLTEWNTRTEGVVCGGLGMLFALLTLLVWRKMEHKPSLHITGKTLGVLTLSVCGALLLGVGMCLCMVWSQMLWGIAVGCVGILLLLGLIPLTKGLK